MDEYLILVEKMSFVPSLSFRMRHAQQFLVTLDHFYHTLDQQVTFLMELDILIKGNFSTSVNMKILL